MAMIPSPSMQPIRSVVQSIALAVPDGILTNADLEKMVETNDEWIVQRTGMKVRRMCSATETSGTLAVEAATKALAKAGIPGSEVDMVICATVTGDFAFPSVSCMVQHAIGAVHAGAFDVGAACAGFVYAMEIANCLIKTGQCKTVVVIGAETLTKFTDYTDRSTCILFGDGAGAAVLRGEADTERGLIRTVTLSDGTGYGLIDLELGGSRYPFGSPQGEGKNAYLRMAGSEVYRFGVKAIGDACFRVLEVAGMKAEDIDLFVPHQANIRIIESAAARLGLPEEKVFINIEKYGNTSAASIPIALAEAEETGRLQRGMVVMTVGFGAGLVWGANLIRW